MSSPDDISESTASVEVPERLIDQVLGQDHAVDVVRLAARQKRFLLIVGEPGTGKSLLGQAVAELLPAKDLEDIVAAYNSDEPMVPRIARHPAGSGGAAIDSARRESKQRLASERYVFGAIAAGIVIISAYFTLQEHNVSYALAGCVVLALLFACRRLFLAPARNDIPKLLVNNAGRASAPFVDATGAQAGALLGDVRHDPYQSGGSETPPHELLEAGAVHRAHGGVLFIDEVSTLSMESQQSLLSAIQARELAITGRSAGSSGSMVRSAPVPCDFLLILAGNNEDIEKMHPALRSRIRGYGYEILTRAEIDDTPENRRRIVQFAAQEVRRDGKIPHVSREGIGAILDEARARAGRSGALTARFRELGGLVRIAGDLAVQDRAALVTADHVRRAKSFALTLEEQQRLSKQRTAGVSPALQVAEKKWTASPY